MTESDTIYVEVNDFLGGESGGSLLALQAHINSATPHPAYDIDMPDLAILLENGLI